MTRPGPWFIVVEGPDGVGKSSTVQNLVQVVEACRGSAVSLAFPGRKEGTLGSLIHQLHHDPGCFGVESITPAALQALHVAAHLDVIGTVIRPLLAGGTSVILDRFWWSTWVYGTVNGMDRQILRGLIEAEKAAWGSCMPDLAILLDRQMPLKPEPPEIWGLLRTEYARLAMQEAANHTVRTVSNEGNPEETFNIICQILAGDIAK